VTRKIADHFGINPLRLISSGCMLIMSSPDKTDQLISAITAAGAPAAVIGKVCSREEGMMLVRAHGGSTEPITPPEPDALYQVIK